MDESITVHVVKYKDRDNLVMRYRCPITGKQVPRSTGTTNRKQAEKAAAKWEAELREGRYQKRGRMGWEEFREFYETHCLAALAVGTAGAYAATLNRFERFCRPTLLADLTTARVTAFVAHLRSDGCAEATVARHLRAIKAATRWANRQGLLAKVPDVTMPKRVRGAKVMRGRPITGEEFDRMLEKASESPSDAPQWCFYLRGLWLSGLRLRESLALSWEDQPGAIVVDLSGKYPMLRIPAEAEKGNRDRLLPITEEFYRLLMSVPENQRRGRVFRVGTNHQTVSRRVTEFGKAAGIVVNRKTKDGEEVVKYASAHDLRRAFGARLSRTVRPTVLREVMRHSSIQTTMAYYVGDDANETAKALWERSENGLGTNPGTIADSEDQEREASSDPKSLRSN